MIAQIVPAVRLPTKASNTFDYLIPDSLTSDLKRGSVVVVPFAGRKVSGLVISTTEVASYAKPLKEIYGIAHDLSPLPPYIIELWTKLSKIFATTLPRFVWAALPTVPTRSIQTNHFLEIQNHSTPLLEKEKVKNIPSYIFINTPGDSLKIVKEIIANSGNQQVLILVPTVDEVITWSKVLGGTLVYHSSLAVGAKYNLACVAASGKAGVVVGTKSAVFLPFSNLSQIIIINAGNSGHQQEDADPRFDARVIATELAIASGAVLTAIDPLLPLGMIANDIKPKSFTPIIHDLHDAAKRARARVLLSEELLSAIDEMVTNDKRVLIVLNRRGVSTSYICRQCGSMTSCPNCVIPLIMHQDRMSCPACDHLYPILEVCSKCGSGDFKSVGSGSKTLFDELKKRYPTTKILHIDRDSWQSNLDEAQIIVGTTAIFSSLSPLSRPFDLVADAFIGAGQAKAGIRTTESIGRILRTLGSLLNTDGQLHIQTFDPIAPAILALSAPHEFLKNEFEERHTFGYPPTKKLLTIYGAGIIEEGLWKEAVDLVVLLRSKFFKASIAEPQWSKPKKFRGKYRLTITAKFDNSQNYDDLIQYLPVGFAVGVNMF